MCAAEKSSRWLLTCIAFLVILVVALIIAVVLMKIGQKPQEVSQSQALIVPSPSLTVTKSLEVTTTKLAEKTSRPTTVTVTPPPTIAPVIVTSKPVAPRNVCESPECITLAHQLHNYGNKSVDPCQDFFQNVCGKYNEHVTAKGSALTKKNQVVKTLIHEFLEKNEETTSKSEIAMKLLYKKCLDAKTKTGKDADEADKLQVAYKILGRIGPLPMMEKNWDESKFDLNEIFSKVAEEGFTTFGFFTIACNGDPFLQITAYRKLVSTSFKEKEFGMFVEIILQANGVQVDKKVLADDIEDFFALEQEMGQFASPAGVMENVPFVEIQKSLPSVDFEKIIRSQMRADGRDEIWEKVKDKIDVRDHPMFFDKTKNLENVLKTAKKRTLANYVLFHVLDVLSSNIENKECFEDVMYEFPMAALLVFVRNHFDKENIKIVTNMIEDLKKSYLEYFQQSTWLHEETRKKAILKLEKMWDLIGYPKELEVSGALDKIYERLDISDADTYFGIKMKNMRFQTERALEYIGGYIGIFPEKKLLNAQASYHWRKNWLTVKVPLMDDPMFDATYPTYAKIAGTGYIIGHEIGHAFDPHNRKRDANGNSNDWWTPEDSAEYDKRAKCFEDEYTNHDDPVYGKTLNGAKTVGEIVADALGIDTAWIAYKQLDVSNEPRIVGFENESLDQMFFRIAALNFCTARNTEPLKKVLQMTHPLRNFRINGMFKNSKVFAEAFNCPAGSPMNPDQKCQMF